MAETNDLLKIYRGKEYALTDTIHISQPTIGQISDFSEQDYFAFISLITATPFDMIAQLDSLGIDFTEITPFQMFCLFVNQFKGEEVKMLFGDIDFSKYEIKGEGNNMYLQSGDSIISEPVYMLMVSYIRSMHNIPAPKYDSVGNEETKKKLIEFAYDDLKYAKRKKYKSQLLNLVSYLVNNDHSKCDFKTVWDMPVYSFFDSIKRIQTINSVDWLHSGIYSGNVDVSKINKKELNSLRDLS